MSHGRAFKQLVPGSTGSSARYSSACLWFITLAQLAGYFTGLGLASWQLSPLEVNPLVGLGRDNLLRVGATSTRNIVVHNEWWRLVTSPFIPAGAIHLWASTSAVWTFGMFLASALRPWQLLWLIVVSAAAGSTVGANVGSQVVISAASGPAFGLIGGTCAALIMHHRLFNHHVLSWVMLVIVLLLNIFIGATTFVDQTANMAGFVAGAFGTLGCLLLELKKVETRRKEWLLRAGCIVCYLIAIAIPILGVLGLSLGVPIGGCCDGLVCTNFKQDLWDCDAARLPGICSLSSNINGTYMFCPATGIQQLLPSSSDQNSLQLLCSSCSGLLS
mmetsp:Transcript_16231/g.27875  ORF Transcript_16231/g.27875 Transcript_16231/m.27875 type:complete len:331 (+) Transcript_16231:77-1069(+)